MNFKLSHPDKILYPEDKITKQNLFEYYEQMQEHMLPYVKNRPLTLVRCPNGYKECFFQKHLTHEIDNLYGMMIKEKNTSGEYIYIKNKNGLYALVQLGVLEIHNWGSNNKNIENPDMLIFDLDPAPNIPWKKVVKAALEIRAHLKEYKLRSFVKSTGGKGLHVVVPIKPEYDWDEVKNFSHVFVDFLVMNNPKDYVSTITKSKRTGKIFIDYLRNQRGATAIAPYSTRARTHATVATPLHWDELTNNIKDTSFTIETMPTRLTNLKKDPWQDYFKMRQSLKLEKIS